MREAVGKNRIIKRIIIAGRSVNLKYQTFTTKRKLAQDVRIRRAFVSGNMKIHRLSFILTLNYFRLYDKLVLLLQPSLSALYFSSDKIASCTLNHEIEDVNCVIVFSIRVSGLKMLL